MFQLVSPVGTKLKRRMFFISVFGVTAPDEYVILKVTQDTSVCDAIAQVRDLCSSFEAYEHTSSLQKSIFRNKHVIYMLETLSG